MAHKAGSKEFEVCPLCLLLLASYRQETKDMCFILPLLLSSKLFHHPPILPSLLLLLCFSTYTYPFPAPLPPPPPPLTHQHTLSWFTEIFLLTTAHPQNYCYIRSWLHLFVHIYTAIVVTHLKQHTYVHKEIMKKKERERREGTVLPRTYPEHSGALED